MGSLRNVSRPLRGVAGLVLAGSLLTGCVANVTRYRVAERPIALAALDTNGDGRQDLAVLDAQTATVKLLVQDEGGTLSPGGAIAPEAGSSPTDVAAGLVDAAGAPL